jgi:predicted glycoside hydrolase/deacetylase ChbG (UPF0249 family)
MKQLLIFLLILLSNFSAVSQKNLAEKLGYPKNTKLLILHADDAGVSHSEDSAIMVAFEKHAITSSSIMVPCPWFPEIAAYAKAHPEMDWGIHLTLTSEWKNYKWDGVLPADKISSLLDSNGYFYSSVQDFTRHANPQEVEAELRAQIERARSFGVRITHLDTHMGSVYASPALVKIFQKLGADYRLPVFQPSNLPGLAIDTNNVVVDAAYIASKAVAAKEWHRFYDSVIQQLKPGLNEIIVHLAFDDDEMRAVTTEHPDFGAAWRQNDFNYITSENLKSLLKKNNIRLVSWGDIQKTR